MDFQLVLTQSKLNSDKGNSHRTTKGGITINNGEDNKRDERRGLVVAQQEGRTKIEIGGRGWV